MADNGENLHIAMFPWLAFGHIIPYLSLAKLIASKGHKITFISTTKNINRLPKIPPNLSPLIKFVNLSLPTVENLPENAEATIDVPFNKVKYLKKAYDGLQEQLASFLESCLPDWILFDFAPYWLGPIAAKLDVRSAFFSIFTAANLGYCGSPDVLLYGGDDREKLEDFIRKPKWVHFDSSIGVKQFQLLPVMENFTDDGDHVGDNYRLGATVHGCDAVVVRTSSDFEPEWLSLLEDIYKKPVIPAGFLPATANYGGDESNWAEIKQWLDKHEKGSVVYIAFGTETKPSQDELTQLAHGLELSELPFFWVLIRQRGASDTGATKLPDGFEERTLGRGTVCTGWAPQHRIVSHDSVGGLLIHCGWSSVVEAFQFGRVLITLPFLADQGLIESHLVEKNLAYSIPRNELDGSFTSESVAESLRFVMVKEEGKMYRDKAKEMSVVFGDREKQDQYVDNLLSYLENHRPIREL